jgi:ATP-dependent DNA helicase RecG
LCNLWKTTKVRIECRKREELRKRLAGGEIDIVVGTTAVNNPNEIFSRLGLIIIDEQHRFGVRQRAQLLKKDLSQPLPHCLSMTATPIPRSIALTSMSHMTCSILDELPPGRLPVQCAPSYPTMHRRLAP